MITYRADYKREAVYIIIEKDGVKIEEKMHIPTFYEFVASAVKFQCKIQRELEGY